MGGKGKHHSRKPNTVRMAYIALALLMVFTIAYSDIFATGNGNGWHGRGKDETAQFGDSGGGETDAAEMESNGNVFGGGSGSGSSETDVAETETKESGLGNGNHGGGATETGNGGSGSGSGSDGPSEDEHGSSGGGSAGGGSEGMLSLTVRVEFMDSTNKLVNPQPETEVFISVEKEAEEEEEDFLAEKWTSDQTAEFEVPFGGECTISGGPASGYETPDAKTVSLTKIQGKFSLNEKLIYKESDIPVESIELDKDEIFLLKGNTDQVTASVLPANANDQEVAWSSSDETVASVEGGEVIAVAVGTAKITAESKENTSIYGECSVVVGEISSIEDPPEITTSTGVLIELPDSVTATVLVPYGAVLNGMSLVPTFTTQVAVEWEPSEGCDGFVNSDNTIVYYEAGGYELEGTIIGSDFIPKQNVTVGGEDLTPATGITLSEGSVSVWVGGTVGLLIETITPEGACISALKWESGDPEVARVISSSIEGAVIEGVSPGITRIKYRIEECGFEGYCVVNVAIDPTITDDVYILAVEDGESTGADQFTSSGAVYIKCVGLTTSASYYLKVEDKGSGEPLTTGTVVVESEDWQFKLYDDGRDFVPTDNYSKEYFVSMSMDPDFPKGDNEDGTPKTLVDNFKIGSPVPTIPIVDITVTLTGSAVDLGKFVGMDVILCREIKDLSAEDTTYEHYLNDTDTYTTLPKYTDEAKLIGKITAGGAVEWKPPKETIKLGGYLLFIEMPPGYGSNLYRVDPDSEDGELMLEVHLKRNDSVTKEIEVFKD